MRLYEATDDYRDIQRIADEEAEANEGVITNETFNMLMEASSSVQECALRSARMIANWQAELPGLKKEIKRLTAKKMTLDNKIGSYKLYVLRELMTLSPDERTISDDVFKISVAKCPASVEVVDEDGLEPALEAHGHLYRFKHARLQIAKSEILDYYRDTGKTPDGCTIITDKQRLSIR